MTVQISAVVLGARDLNLAKRFYSEGLGCPIKQDQGGYVALDLGDGSPALALYTRGALADDAGVAADGSGFSGVTLNYIVPSTERVDEVLAQAERAGGKLVKPAERAKWGGYFGYFADPDGHLWKVVSAAG